MKTRTILLGLAVAATFVIFWSRGWSMQPTSLPALPVVKRLPEFTFLKRDGRTVTRDDLLGSIWIADFIFTTCAGPCPTLSLRMRSLQQGIAKYDGDVKLVSFSVDPTYDQPPVLRAYAKRYQADPKLWWFLTSGDEESMHELVQKGFLQALSPSTGGSAIIHSTQFVLVDRKGAIRTWYDGLEAASKALILRDVEILLSEPSG